MNLQAAPGWALWAAAAFGTIAALSFGGAAVLLFMWWRGRDDDVPAVEMPSAHDYPPSGGSIETTGQMRRPAELEHAGRSSPRAEAEDTGRHTQQTELDNPTLSDEAIETIQQTLTPLADPPTRFTDQPRDPSDLSTSVRSTIIAALVDRCPAGWTALILTPPAHARQMIWHVHPRADVALDLADGRTVPTEAPAPTYQWTPPSGRRASQSSGDPQPPPGPETTVVRVSGPYLNVSYQVGPPASYLIRISSPGGQQHELQTNGDSLVGLSQILADALSTILRDPKQYDAVAMGYRPTSWNAHDRAWLRISGA